MKILVTGKGGTAGSWQMRGEQLGAALGATVLPNARSAEGFDVSIVVKKTPGHVIEAVRRGRWLWDIVDTYPQPEAYAWGREQAVAWVRTRLDALRPTGVIWPTQHMRDDCDPGLPGLVLPHHHRIGIEPNPIRSEIKTVGYDGAPSYLGRWGDWVRAECNMRGWQFVINPARAADVDILVALRDGGGYVCQHWKSGVKLANAHASGTPFVGQPECGYIENQTGGEQWVGGAKAVGSAFDELELRAARLDIAERFRRKAYPVERAAADLRKFLDAL